VADDKDKAGTGLSVATSVSISVVSVTLLVIHLAWPQAKVDATALALLGLAFLPWLAPVLKTIQLGGLKLELRDLRREVSENLAANRQRVEALADRVEKLTIAFSGSLTPELERILSAELDRFNSHLAAEGIELPETVPSVSVDEGLTRSKGAISYYDYDDHRIHIDSAYADDPDLILREYSHHVLVAPLGQLSNTDWFATGQYAVESALADYFVGSFREDPSIYSKTAERVGDSWLATNLENDKRFGRSAARSIGDAYSDAAAWGAIFWRTRALLGGEAADSLLFSLWRDQNSQEQEGDFRSAFAAGLVASVSRQSGQSVAAKIREAIRARGLPSQERAPQ
jgi:hypothetical protein